MLPTTAGFGYFNNCSRSDHQPYLISIPYLAVVCGILMAAKRNLLARYYCEIHGYVFGYPRRTIRLISSSSLIEGGNSTCSKVVQ